MPSIQRPLSGDVLVFRLDEEREQAMDSTILERSGRNARTLLKTESLRVTLVVLAAGGRVAEHVADATITVQPLAGRIQFEAQGRVHDIGPGEILAAAPGVPHSVRSAEGATFLLTLGVPPATPPHGV